MAIHAHQSPEGNKVEYLHLKNDKEWIKALFDIIRSQTPARTKCKEGIKVVLVVDSRRPASRAELFLGSPNWRWYLSM
jgi:hypothetical protein